MMRVLTPHDQQRSGWFLAIHLASLFLGLDGQYGVPLKLDRPCLEGEQQINHETLLSFLICFTGIQIKTIPPLRSTLFAWPLSSKRNLGPQAGNLPGRLPNDQGNTFVWEVWVVSDIGTMELRLMKSLKVSATYWFSTDPDWHPNRRVDMSSLM